MFLNKFAKNTLKKMLARSGFKIVRLTPMEKVFLKLDRKGIKTKELNALEVFGKIGTYHTQDYVKQVKTLNVWEINPIFEESLKINLPTAKVKITDSFEEMKITDGKYNLIVVDNSILVYGENQKYCEHFELFPHIFRIMQDETILILNVLPRLEDAYKEEYFYLFNSEHLRRRRIFYLSDHPENLTFDEIINAYLKYTKMNGFNVEWFFIQKRRPCIYYLILKLKRN